MQANCQTCESKFTYYPSNSSGKYCSKKCCYENKEWRNKIIERDGGKCVSCGNDGNNVDHIIPFASLYKECEILGSFDYLYDIDNGRLMCEKCHRGTGTYAMKTDKQVEHILISEIEKKHKEVNYSIDLKTYYLQKMNAIIEHLKGKIE